MSVSENLSAFASASGIGLVDKQRIEFGTVIETEAKLTQREEGCRIE